MHAFNKQNQGIIKLKENKIDKFEHLVNKISGYLYNFGSFADAFLWVDP